MQGRLHELGIVLRNRCLEKDYYYTIIKAPKIAAITHPGQFVFIRCTSGTAPYLRRPISVCRVDREAGIIELLIKIVGQGTKIISNSLIGGEVDLMGPIGTPFPIIEGSSPLVVAGGVGIAPLTLLVQRLSEEGISPALIYGARTRNQLFLLNDLNEISEVKVTTEDGSYGRTGFPTDYLEEELGLRKYTHIYTCGPKDMLGKVQEIAAAHSITGFVSLEERLACGIGACSGCVFPMRLPEGKRTYKKVCVDGPVFSLEEVIFNE